jgi:hypothetical protein
MKPWFYPARKTRTSPERAGIFYPGSGDSLPQFRYGFRWHNQQGGVKKKSQLFVKSLSSERSQRAVET